MTYTSLEDYRYRWFFEHKDLPVEQDNLPLIKPLSEESATQIWIQLISKRVNHPELFEKDDWPQAGNTWEQTDNWQDVWESEDMELPDSVLEALDWEPETVVYFCYHSEHIIQTTWKVFKACWKNFLFLDNGPILIGKRRLQALQFLENGQVKIGNRGSV